MTHNQAPTMNHGFYPEHIGGQLTLPLALTSKYTEWLHPPYSCPMEAVQMLNKLSRLGATVRISQHNTMMVSSYVQGRDDLRALKREVVAHRSALQRLLPLAVEHRNRRAVSATRQLPGSLHSRLRTLIRHAQSGKFARPGILAGGVTPDLGLHVMSLAASYARGYKPLEVRAKLWEAYGHALELN